MNNRSSLQVVWFKRDLRTHDHRPLVEAAQCGPVLPLYIAEPGWWQQPDASARQWRFVEKGLHELREALGALGQPLVCRTGSAVQVFQTLYDRHGPFTLWSHEETGNRWTYKRDQQVTAWMRARGLAWNEHQPAGVIRRLSQRDGWARRWDRAMAQAQTPAPGALAPLSELPIGTIPSASDLGMVSDPCPQQQEGGRGAGLSLLHSFLAKRAQPYRHAMSSPTEGAIHCSRLSPHLAWGTLSMREISQAAQTRRAQIKEAGTKDGWPEAMSSFQARLHWRDHFMQKLEDQPAVEFSNFHPAYDNVRPVESDAARLTAWRSGETGLPFVDACLRSLHATGWLNFRMRAMVMAVASYHLWLDWRAPGEHLARQFTDYEPGIHWPQVQMQSGTTGINTVRIYNPVKQGYDQDPNGDFVRQWVPELADVPGTQVHEPWKWDGAGRILDRTYPTPIVDHLTAAREARDRIWAVRGSSAFRQTAHTIQDRHGSRKSNIPQVGRPARKTTRKPASKRQMNLPL